MALADTARLIASLELQDKFTRPAANAERALGGLERRTGSFSRIGGEVSRGVGTAVSNIQRLGVVAGGIIAANVAAGVASLSRLEDVETQTKAVLASTRGAAGLTADQVRDLAQQYEDLNATIDDKVIQSGENLLLTFTAIDKKGFQPALQAALDMNQAMGGGEEGLQQTIIRVGKALQDPIKGATALRRVGVNLTDQQQDQIKTLVESNDLYGAQQLILQELSKEFGGSFAAAGDTATAKFAKVRDAVEDAQQALATAFLPVLTKVADKLSTFLADPAVIKRIQDFGQQLAGGFEKAVEFGSKIPWGTIGTSLSIAGKGAKAVLDAFLGLPSWIQTAVLTGWGLNKLTGGALGNIAGELTKGLIGGFAQRGSSAANPLWTREVGLGGAGGNNPLSGGKGFWAGLGAVFGVAAAAIIADRIVEETQKGLKNARTVREGGIPTGVVPANIGPTVQLNKDLFMAQGLLAQDLRAGLGIKEALERQPEALRASLAAAIVNNPLQQKALGLTEDQIRWLDSLDGKVDRVGTEINAEGLKQSRRDGQLIDEAKAGRLATAHAGQATTAAFKSLEAKLLRDPSFKPKVDSAAEFIRLLKRTSEFGAKGVGTSIEHGPTTGRDPFGSVFVSLVKRLDANTLKSPVVLGEIKRHIIAAEEVQRTALKQGDVHAAKKLQVTIDALHTLTGTVDKHRPILSDIKGNTGQSKDENRRTTAAVRQSMDRTAAHLTTLGVGIDRTAGNTATIARKNFSPRVTTNVTVNSNVSVNDIVRASITQSVASGSGPGGPAPVGII